MSFLYPAFLWLLIPTSLLFFIRMREKREGKFPFAKEIIVHKSSKKQKLLPLVLIFLILAAARVVKVEKIQTKESINTIFLALDISRSMRAEDLKPNRFEYAKEVINNLLDTNQRYALIAFTSNPLLLSPPTSDTFMIQASLNALNQKFIISHSTDIKKTLEFIAKFEEKEKNVILLSDGGDISDISPLVNICKKNGINLFILGTATKEGSLIKTDEGYLKSAGKVVVTRLNPKLKELATSCNGEFFYSSDPISDAKNLLKNIEFLNKKERLKQKRGYVEYYYIFLLIAMILFLYINTTVFNKIFKFLIPFILVLKSNASILDEYYIKKGYEFYQMGKYKKALEYLLLSKPSLQRQIAIANSYLHLKKYKKAFILYNSIKTNDIFLKSFLYERMGDCLKNLKEYSRARSYFVKSLELKKSKRVMQKLSKIVFLKKRENPLHFNPKKEAKSSDKKENSSKKNKKTGGSNMNAAGFSSFGGGKDKKQKSKNMIVLIKKKKSNYQLSSKVYEMINKGYINEKNPW